MDEDLVRIHVDPQVHSEGSYDGKESVDLILEHAKNIGLDAVIVTDHDSIEESIKAAEMAESYGLIGISGIEVSTKSGHLLGLGVREKPEKKQSLHDTIKEIRDLGGVAAIPHPFQKTRHGISKRKIKEPDAIETYNSWLFTGFRNRRAQKFAKKRDIPEIAASDAHSISTIGRAYTEIVFKGKNRGGIGKKDIIEAIKNGQTNIYGCRVPIIKSGLHYMKGITRKIPKKISSH